MSMLFQEGRKTGAFVARDYQEVAGINNRVQLAWAEGIMRARINEALMLSGVSMQDPGSVWIDAGVEIGQDTVILPNTHIYGATKIGSNCTIGPDAMPGLVSWRRGSPFTMPWPRNAIGQEPGRTLLTSVPVR